MDHPKEYAYLHIKTVEKSMDEHAKRIAIGFRKWLQQHKAITISYSDEELYEKYINSIIITPKYKS